MSKLRIFHFYANSRNLGDYYSAMGIREALEIAFSGFNDEFWYSQICVESPSYSNKPLRNLEEKISNISSRDIVLIGGGALLHPFFLNFWTMILKNRNINQIYLLGIGAVKNQADNSSNLNQIFEQNRFRFHTAIVRDDLTKEFLESSRIPVEKMFCPSLIALDSELSNIPYQRNRNPSSTKILLVRHKEIESLGLLNNGNHINFQHINTLNKDKYQLSQTSNVSFFGLPFEARRILKKYVSSDLIISSRLHGNLIAFASRKPILTFNFDAKIENFMNDAFIRTSTNKTQETGIILNTNNLDTIMTHIIQMPKQIDSIENLRRENLIFTVKNYYKNFLAANLREYL